MGKTTAEQFLQAAQSGELSIVQSYIRENKNHIELLNTAHAEQFHLPAIALASQNGHIDIVKELIAAGADVNAKFDKGATALFTAVWSGHRNIVRLLVKTHGINLDAAVANGDTPLSLAARMGHLKIVQRLLHAGATIPDYEKLVARTKVMGLHDITQILEKYSAQQSNPAIAKKKSQRIKRSREVFEDLDRRGLIDHYSDWSDKTSGVMSGATLYGVNKYGQQKKVYVKSYADGGLGGGGGFDELIDYAGFYILKKCGVRAPRAKLKGNIAEDNANLSPKIYMFSTDIAQETPEHPAKRYRFFEVSHIPTGAQIWNGALKSQTDLFPEVEAADEDMNKNYFEYPLEANSAIRLSFLGQMMGLSDLHSENTGYVISNDHGKSKTKFGVIDFCNHVNYLQPIPQKSLATLIDDDYFYVSGADRKKLQLSDYIAAFAKIEANFLSACDEVKASVHAMPFISKDRKLMLNRVITAWTKRFTEVSAIVKNAQDNIQVSHPGMQ